MDAESLKIILELKKENEFLKRGIDDAVLMLVKKEKHLIISYDIGHLSSLFGCIYDILADIKGEERTKRVFEEVRTILLDN